MPLVRRIVWVGVFGLTAVSILMSVWFAGTASAQTNSAAASPVGITPARALAFMRAADQHLDYMPGEVLVRFKDGVSVAGQQRALMALRSRPAVSELQWVGDAALFTDQLEMDATILAAQLAEQPEVAYAEPNYLRHNNVVPNDPGYSRSQWNFKALDMSRAWDLNPGGNNRIIVAVVDSGITTVNHTLTAATWNGRAIQTINIPFLTNPDLAASRLIAPRDFVSGYGTTVLDMVGHGTHVSSTIGEDTNNALAEAGIAYAVKIMPVKVCVGFWEVQFELSASGIPGFAPLDAGGCPTDAIAQGIRYAADNGAKVINLSLGGFEPSILERDAINYAVSKGVFFAIAAGNEYEDGNPVEYPAALASAIDGVMAVGAIGPSTRRAYYSNTGSHLEIAAPGGSFREGGFAGLIWQATIAEADSDPFTVLFPRFDRYEETPNEGTSMAAPHVSGIAALLISQGVTQPGAVEALIKATARDLGPAGRDNEYGYGLIQPRAALFGFGIAR